MLLAGQEQTPPLFSFGRRNAKEGQFVPLFCRSEAWLPVPSSGEGLPFLWDVWAKSSSCSCSGGGVNAATALPKRPVLCQTRGHTARPGEGCSHVGAWWPIWRYRALGTASSSCCKQESEFCALGCCW